MIKIKKLNVGFPQKEVSCINISVLTFNTVTEFVSTYWELCQEITYNLIDEQGNNVVEIAYPVIANGNYQLTAEQYALWGASNVVLENFVISGLGLQRL